jgi:uncharacterized iron-regulated membrane protein
MTLRRILFWTHLSAGVVAGIVIFIMSVTGVLLAYEKQIMRWGNREFRVENTGQQRLSVTDILANFKNTPTAVTLRSDSAAVEVSLGRDRIVFVNPYTGDPLGESSGLPRFFSQVENVHRWLGVSDANRSTGRAITGACNFAFFILVITGPFIWWPKDWGWANLKKIVIFRRGLGGRAMYWNWHNVLGAWCVIPLLVIVTSGVVMSYPWANNLLYRLTGNEPPAPPQVTAGQQRPRGEGKPHDDTAAPSSVYPLEKVITAAEQISGWRSITVRMPSGRGPLSATADQGDGRPDMRTQFIFDPITGDVRQESFSSYNSGRRLRTWTRFSHTGEAGGFVGETIAALAAAGASLLVFTGITLSIKRLIARRARA